MIAMAIVERPQVLIADEPTTALDVTIQAQILCPLERLQQPAPDGGDLITHDLGLVAVCGTNAVMYAGRIVEPGTLDQIFYDPQHPYTWGLLGSLAHGLIGLASSVSPQIKGQPPSLLAPPQGCHFRPRCPHAFDEVHRGTGARGPQRRARPCRSLLAFRGAEADSPCRGGGPLRA